MSSSPYSRSQFASSLLSPLVNPETVEKKHQTPSTGDTGAEKTSIMSPGIAPKADPFDDTSSVKEDFTPHEISLGLRTINLVTIVVPFVATLGAMFLLWGRGFNWVHLSILAVGYSLTVLGVTVGFHRLFTHKSFETSRFMRAILAVLGCMSVEGPLLKWVAMHRRHHQNSDMDHDPHSPHLHGDGFKGMLQGLWHAHAGWMFEAHAPATTKQVQDLYDDKIIRKISKMFPYWALASLILPGVVAAAFLHTWTAFALGMLWGGLVRIFLVHHVTWSINSVCHLWGGRPYRSQDESRNNVVFGILAFGEGWHNNHHAFPTSARHGLAWWQVDISYMVITVMKWFGLVWNVRVPGAAALAAKKR